MENFDSLIYFESIYTKGRDVFKGEGWGSPKTRPYDVSHGQNRYVTLPIDQNLDFSEEKIPDLYPSCVVTRAMAGAKTILMKMTNKPATMIWPICDFKKFIAIDFDI